VNKSDPEDFLQRGNVNLLPAIYFDDKDAQVLTRMARIIQRCQDEDSVPSLLLSLLRLPREFKKIRSVAHIRRIISAEYFYKKQVIKASDQYPHKRHLFVKLLKTHLEFPFGTKMVLGIFVAFNLLKQREAFEEGHILESLRNNIPGVIVVKGSFIDNQDKKNQVHVVYLEIEREEQPEFTLEEINRLQACLPRELKGCIEELVPITFMRRNEEEVYRNILSLRDQLKSVKDIPQTTISFEEQTQFDLFYTVVLLRVVKEHAQPLQEIMEKKNPGVIFIPDRVDCVGRLRKHYKKEATVFRVQLPKSQFFRKNRSVNLYKARQKVFSMLVQALGPVRDYNGGLILKQNERLGDFIALTPELEDEFLQENFFYSITPIAMQSILPAALVKEWFLAFSELLEKDLSRKEAYLLLCRSIEDAQLAIVRAEDSSFKELLLKEINHLAIPSLELAFSEVNLHGAFCFGLLYRPSLVGKERDFCKIIKQTMDRWSEQVEEGQALRIALYGEEPSLDPRISKGEQSYIIMKMLFDGLTRIGLDGKPELAIAESYTVSQDFKTYTFHLRDSKWSNGAPITAYDFEYTWKNVLNPKSHSGHAHALYLIKNAKLARENLVPMEDIGIQAVDAKTLVVILEYPAPYFLYATAHWTYSLINSAIDQKYPGWAYQAGEKYVCNGPFKLIERTHARTLTFEKNPLYWDAAKVKLKKISVTMLDRLQNGSALLSCGLADMVGTSLVPKPVISLHDEVERLSYPLNSVLAICFNASQFPFNHKKIRQAFGLALNRSILGKLVPHEFGGACHALLPCKLSLHPECHFPEENLAKARTYFREGLGEIGFVKSDFPRLVLNYSSSHARFPLFKQLCKQWKEAFGIDVHLKRLDQDSHADRLIKGKYQIGSIELNAYWADPLHILELFEDKKDSRNIFKWEDPFFKMLLFKAKQAASFEERNGLLREAEAFLAEQMPAIPLYQLSVSYLKKKNLKNVFTADLHQLDFKWTQKE
jgi:oligopeptide transport system substrate-binding protein